MVTHPGKIQLWGKLSILCSKYWNTFEYTKSVLTSANLAANSENVSAVVNHRLDGISYLSKNAIILSSSQLKILYCLNVAYFDRKTLKLGRRCITQHIYQKSEGRVSFQFTFIFIEDRHACCTIRSFFKMWCNYMCNTYIMIKYTDLFLSLYRTRSIIDKI